MTVPDLVRPVTDKLLAARARHQPADLSAEVLAHLDEATAIHVQQLTIESLNAAIAGWKVAAPPGGVVLAAPILHGLLFHNGVSLPQHVHGLGGIECEIAFRIGRLLPERGGTVPYGRDEIAACLDGACAAVEVLRSRLPKGLDSPRNAMLADMLSNAALVVSDTVAAWRHIDFAAIPIELAINGRAVISRQGGLPSGDPLGAVTALANHLDQRGQGLQPGQFVTTGSYTGVHYANPGDLISVRFHGLPELRFAFDASPSKK